MTVEFRVLGTLEVVVGGRVVPIMAAKHRVVLAALLLHSGRPLGTMELVDALCVGGGRESASYCPERFADPCWAVAAAAR